MSYVMPEEDFTWPCVRSVEIGCTSCFLSGLAIIYSFVKHCHHYVIPILGSVVFVIFVYFLVSDKVSDVIHPRKYGVGEVTGFTLIVLSFCIRTRFRYLIFPFIYTEHCRIFNDVYLAWWRHRIFTRINLGMDDDDPCIDSVEEAVETFTDYVLCFIVNILVSVGFLISFVGLIVVYCLCNVFLHVWPIFLVAGFAVYPALFIPDLLLAACHHLKSSSGAFSLLLLKSLFSALNFYLRFVYNVQYDILEWLEIREEYSKLCKLLIFLCFHATLGPRAFVYLNNEASLGYYTDSEDMQRYNLVSLSMAEYNSLAWEVTVTQLAYVSLLCVTSSGELGNIINVGFSLRYGAPILAAITLCCELYIYVLWPRWTPKSLKTSSSVFPSASEEEDIYDG